MKFFLNLIFILTSPVAMGISLLLSGCSDKMPIVVKIGVFEEGKGVSGLCEVGQKVSEVRQTMKDLDLVTVGDVESRGWYEFESKACQLIIASPNTGTSARVGRIEVHFPFKYEFVTQRGLIIQAGEHATVTQIEDVYGTINSVVKEANKRDMINIVPLIKERKPYAIIDNLGQYKYHYYPKDGLIFVSSTGLVEKVFINNNF
jgi:hypothetical protein